MGPFTVKPVVKSVAGHISNETLNDTIKKILVSPEFITDHAAMKTFCPVPEKPFGLLSISMI